MIDISFSSIVFGIFRYYLNQRDQLGRIEKELDLIDLPEESKAFMREPTDYEMDFFDHALNYYEISPDDFPNGRIKALREFGAGRMGAKKEYQCRCEELDVMRAQIRQGMPVRIWYSKTSSELCGLYYIAHLIRDLNAEVFLVPAPDEAKNNTWARIDLNEVSSMLSLAHKAEKEEMAFFAQEWERLSTENAPMRVMKNGKVISVSDDYYDEKILSFSGREPISMIELIGKSLGNIPDGLQIWFVRNRIYSMIESGKLKIVGRTKSKRIPGTHIYKIKKAKYMVQRVFE